VYKDALEYEFRKAGIPYAREVEYIVNYKEAILRHKFYADFVAYGKIILEIKGMKALSDENLAQTLNYLKVSSCRLGILVNFGELKLNYIRVVL
jgi:GxxExxY protein